VSHLTRLWLRLPLRFSGDGAALCPWVKQPFRASLNVLKIASGVPHQLTTDDNYRGYFLPKGSTVLFNAWSVILCLRADPRLIDSQGNHPE